MLLILDEVKLVIENLFTKYGFSEDASHTIAEMTVYAESIGKSSHGIQRIPMYIDLVSRNIVNPTANYSIIQDTKVSSVINAEGMLGVLASTVAMECAIEKANNTGIGIVNVINSTNFGIGCYYSEMAVSRNCIGICMSNTKAGCVPLYSHESFLGTNPISFAMPARPYPFSLDMSTTITSIGQIECLKRNNKNLPLGWAIGPDGMPCISATELLQNISNHRGGILTLGGNDPNFGGHKGLGLSVIVEIMTAILGGGITSNEATDSDIAHMFCAIDLSLFGNEDEIINRLSKYLAQLEAVIAKCGKMYSYPGKHRYTNSKCKANNLIDVEDSIYESFLKFLNESRIKYYFTGV